MIKLIEDVYKGVKLTNKLSKDKSENEIINILLIKGILLLIKNNKNEFDNFENTLNEINIMYR